MGLTFKDEFYYVLKRLNVYGTIHDYEVTIRFSNFFNKMLETHTYICNNETIINVLPKK